MAQFDFDYPENNFRLTGANLIIDTQKDGTDTEAVVVDGYYTGYTVGNEHTSPFVTQDWSCLISYLDDDNSHCPTTGNYYYSDHSLTHYSIDEKNTFDLDIQDVFSNYAEPDDGTRESSSYETLYNNISDGRLELFLGDDSPIYKAVLVITGLTISDDALVCVNSDQYTFKNTFVHNDGSSSGLNMFSGTTIDSFQSATGSAGESVQFHFDQLFPKVADENLTISSAILDVNIQRTASSSKIALIISGLGISESGFDRNTATSNVEEWILDSTCFRI